MSHFLEIDTTPSDEACIILHHHYGDASGPITGDYKCATSWKFHEAIHQQIFDYDDDLQTWQTLYGCGPRTLDGSVWNGDFWCDAVDATGEYVGWCECEPASLAPTSAPTEFQTPPFNVDGNTTSTCIAPPDGAAFAEDADGTGRCAAYAEQAPINDIQRDLDVVRLVFRARRRPDLAIYDGNGIGQ